ncbi:MAG: NAD(P)-dependent oxidoreductase [Alicyclobacillaceae bacterium]|nr:NAD(P)-dependent oxidoreductase [Alicyclobacillaceae bacterium]
MTRIGITGGSGYIGSRLAEFFRERGYEVRILDPRRPRVDVTWIPGDVQDPDCLEWFCDSLDYVFDFAAVSGIPPCAREPERCLTTNSWRGPLLSTLARKSPNLKGYLYPSTCAPLFAGYEPGTVVDETTPPRPSSIYGISKWTGEQVVTALARLFSLPVTIFRQSNVYGPSPAGPPPRSRQPSSKRRLSRDG